MLVLGELGWPGFFLLVALLLRWLLSTGRSLRSTSFDVVSQLNIGTFVMLIVVGLNNLTECNLANQFMHLPFYMILGFTVASGRVLPGKSPNLSGSRLLSAGGVAEVNFRNKPR